MCERLLVISGAWKGKTVKVVTDSDLSSERWKDSVLVIGANYQGCESVRRIEKDNLMAITRFRFRPGDKVIVKDEVGGPAGVIIRSSKKVDYDGNRTNEYTIDWGVDGNHEEVVYEESQIEFAPRSVT